MALLIGSMSIQACYCEDYPMNIHFSLYENFPHKSFPLEHFAIYSIIVSTAQKHIS